jgi:hypothetical protein
VISKELIERQIFERKKSKREKEKERERAKKETESQFINKKQTTKVSYVNMR